MHVHKLFQKTCLYWLFFWIIASCIDFLHSLLFRWAVKCNTRSWTHCRRAKWSYLVFIFVFLFFFCLVFLLHFTCFLYYSWIYTVFIKKRKEEVTLSCAVFKLSFASQKMMARVWSIVLLRVFFYYLFICEYCSNNKDQ